MTYELTQFYGDEISSWENTISTLNNGTDQHLSRISLILKMKTSRNQANLLHDQFTIMLTYINDFDELKMHLFSQRQRLDRLYPSKESIDSDLANQQDKLRNKIYTLQSTFCRAEYRCSMLVFNSLKQLHDN